MASMTRTTSHTHRIFLGASLLAWLVLGMGILITLVAYHFVGAAITQQADERFRSSADDIRSALQSRFDSYAGVVIGLKAQVDSSYPPDREAFRRYVESMSLTDRFPGFWSLNFARQVMQSEKTAFEAKVRAETPYAKRPFRIWPEGERPVYHTLEFVEPRAQFDKTFGRDISVPRGYAIDAARDSGILYSSGLKVENPDVTARPGLAVRIPVYRPGMPLGTVEARRVAYFGSVGAAFSVIDTIRGAVDDGLLKRVNVRLLTAQRPGAADKPRDLLADSHSLVPGRKVAEIPVDHRLAVQHALQLANVQLLLEMSGDRRDFLSGSDKLLIPSIMAIGILISLLLFFLTTTLTSSRRRAEQLAMQMTVELRSSEQRFRDVVEAAGEFIWETDVAGNLTFLSERANELLGETAGGAVGSPLTQLFLPSDETDQIARHLRNGIDFRSVEVAAQHADGHSIWLSVSAKPVTEQQQLRGFRGAGMDITERKRHELELLRYKGHLEDLVRERTSELERAKEEAVQANHAKTAFLSNVTHELRTPLHVIMNFADIGSEDAGSPDLVRRSLDRIKYGSNQLMALINDLLDIAKLEARKEQFLFEVNSWTYLLEQAVEDIQSIADNREVKLALRLQIVHDHARFDAAKLAQVLRNLLSNAIKFSPSGATVDIVAEEVGAEESCGMLIRVLDQGAGVPPDELEQIFEKFFQSSNRPPGSGGTGLGLSICREIVTMHEGRIWAQNRPEGGCEVSLWLPYKD